MFKWQKTVNFLDFGKIVKHEKNYIDLFSVLLDQASSLDGRRTTPHIKTTVPRYQCSSPRLCKVTIPGISMTYYINISMELIWCVDDLFHFLFSSNAVVQMRRKTMTTWHRAPIHKAVRRLLAKSREVSKRRDWMLSCSYRFVIWKASRPLKFQGDWKSEVKKIKTGTSWLRDFTRSYGKTPVCFMNRSPDGRDETLTTIKLWWITSQRWKNMEYLTFAMHICFNLNRVQTVIKSWDDPPHIQVSNQGIFVVFHLLWVLLCFISPCIYHTV